MAEVGVHDHDDVVTRLGGSAKDCTSKPLLLPDDELHVAFRLECAHLIARVVRRAVIDDDDFEFEPRGAACLEKTNQERSDVGALVQRGNHDGDASTDVIRRGNEGRDSLVLHRACFPSSLTSLSSPISAHPSQLGGRDAFYRPISQPMET
jgi:hypothetical protein